MVNPFAWRPCHFWPLCWQHRFVRVDSRWYCFKHGRPMLEGMELVRVYANRFYIEPHVSVMNRRAEDYQNGKVYRCVYCGKRFVHDDKHTAYGYCVECS